MIVERSEPINSLPCEGARRDFVAQALRRRSRLAVQSRLWAAQRFRGAGLHSTFAGFIISGWVWLP